MKEYKGRKYAVSCRQLGVPESKAESYQAANEWWERKKREIDGQQAAPSLPTVVQEAAERICAGDADAVALLQKQSDALRQLLALLENRQPDTPPAELIPEIQAVADAVAVPSERTVRRHFERWVQTQQARVAAGQLAPDQADNLRIALAHFQEYVGPGTPVDNLDAMKLQSFFLHCLQREWSTDYKKKVFNTARVFIRWLWESGLIDLPRNLDSKGFRFNGGAKNIETWTPQEVRRVITAAPGQLKLHLLLMLNCGMTQQDVSDLQDDEVDWQEGRVVRKRSKTSDNENVPVVNYKLWPLTWTLLRRYRSGQATVLLTESGKPFLRKELRYGRLAKADNIRSNFAHVQKRLKFRKSLKLLRKTAATLLESHETYARFTSHFLGHSPRSIKDRHYAAPSRALFDAALLWLGEQLGFSST
jgi:integrase